MDSSIKFFHLNPAFAVDSERSANNRIEEQPTDIQSADHGIEKQSMDVPGLVPSKPPTSGVPGMVALKPPTPTVASILLSRSIRSGYSK